MGEQPPRSPWEPKQGCWSKAENTPLPSLEQRAWMEPTQSPSEPASPQKPQEGDKVPSCAVVALDKPRDVLGEQRTAVPPWRLSQAGQPEASGKSLLKS